jgi:nitric oxide synthase-interacting protein
MSRHSKNNTSNPIFTYYERQKHKYGTISQRIGSDSVKNFDSCSLCLQTAIEPVCCKKGHLFCKECIYEYLLNQKNEIQKLLKKYEEQQKKIKEEEEQKLLELKEKKIKEFDKTILSIIPNSTSIDNNLSLNQNDLIDKKQTLNSFWVPGVTKDINSSLIEKPSTETYCPDDKHILRLKELIKINFSLNKNIKNNENSHYQCGVCCKTLTNKTKCGVLKKCGHVLCINCLNEVKKDKICSICSKPVKEKYIIIIHSGGTGYAGSLGEKLKPTTQEPVARY